jgi:hypothetical protein
VEARSGGGIDGGLNTGSSLRSHLHSFFLFISWLSHLLFCRFGEVDVSIGGNEFGRIIAEARPMGARNGFELVILVW